MGDERAKLVGVGRVFNWREMNELEGLGDENVAAVRKWEQREWKKREDCRWRLES